MKDSKEPKKAGFKFSVSPSSLKKLLDILKSTKGSKILMVVGIIGIALIGFSTLLPKKEAAKEETPVAQYELKTEDYVKQLEKELSELVSKIEGAGDSKVMVTLESGVRYLYADEKRINNDNQESGNSASQKESSENSVVIIDTPDGKKGLLVTELQPQVKGVVVVCEGGDNQQVKEQITELLTTLLNLSTRRVGVAKLKS